MALETRQAGLMEASGVSDDQMSVTIGIVVDTNDPQNMGRLRVVCAQWGDTMSADVEALPWALYLTPFGGHSQVGTRGPGIQQSEGSVAYGMWAIPKVGSQVAVMCVDGNPMTRLWIGSIYDQFTPHTMPHGRFMYEDHPALEKKGATPVPYGPYTSSETYIQPLADNLKQHFGNESAPNFEYRTRGADYTVSRVAVDQLNQTYSQVADDEGVKNGNWTSTQGYQASRTDPNAQSTLTDKNYDPLTYAITTPGFHSFSMDDRQENCRIRIRSTAGAQILLDDTNERIYIAPAQGNSWVEIDQNGNIDVFSGNYLSLHATKDINMTAGESIRLTAGQGIHLNSGTEIRASAATNVEISATAEFKAQSVGNFSMESSATLSALGSNVKITGDGTLHLASEGTIAASAGGTMGISGSSVLVTGGTISHNGATAPSASYAQPAGAQPAFFTNRVPNHEPWARTMTAADTGSEPELAYDSPNVGRVERGVQIPRGMFWRR